MATIGERLKTKPTSGIQVVPYREVYSRQDGATWFDSLLPRVRSLRAFLDDAGVVAQIVPEGVHTAERVWLCLNAAKVLDGK